MLKSLLFSLITIFFLQNGLFAQSLTVNNITTTGRLSACGSAFGAPVVNITYISGPGSTVINGELVCLNPCDSTIIEVAITNVRWNQTPGINWIHGFFFPPGGATGFTFLNSSLSPANWFYTPGGCTGACTTGGQFVGGAGYYYRATTASGCCPIGGTTPNPCDNWGDGNINCNVSFNVTFQMKLCNSIINGSPRTLRLNATADGNTGCWTIADATFNSLLFQFNTVACAAPLFTPIPASTAPIQTCTPAQNFTATYTGGCGNTSTITWWTAATGGTQVGSGSPFVYDPPGSVCPGTLYAQCCPTVTSCVSRRAVSGGVCAAPLVVDSLSSTGASCTNASA